MPRKRRKKRLEPTSDPRSGDSRQEKRDRFVRRAKQPDWLELIEQLPIRGESSGLAKMAKHAELDRKTISKYVDGLRDGSLELSADDAAHPVIAAYQAKWRTMPAGKPPKQAPEEQPFPKFERVGDSIRVLSPSSRMLLLYASAHG